MRRPDRTALVVDDDAEIRACLSLALESDGWRVTTAPDGAAALQALMTSPVPDLILADVEMPNLDGVGLCNCLRLLPRLAGVPFVQMSAWRPARHAEGAVAMLQKPIDLEALLNLAHSVSTGKAGGLS
jgi:CheY-like chemotaxis protein